jgi:hypothetical protein
VRITDDINDFVDKIINRSTIKTEQPIFYCNEIDIEYAKKYLPGHVVVELKNVEVI